MKTCSRCGARKPVTEFPLRRKDGSRRYTHCRDCKAIYQRQWYVRNAERHRAVTAANRAAVRRKNKAMVWAAKDKPCADCGRRYPPFVMDLDHVRGRKVGNIAHMKTYATQAALVAEIAKCDVVCSNCHRMRSHARAQKKRLRASVRRRSAPSGMEQLRLEWVAGGSNSEPWA